MKNIFSLLIIGVAGFKLAASFLNPDELVTFFGAEVNIWMYRLIWFAAGLLSVYAIIKDRTKKTES